MPKSVSGPEHNELRPRPQPRRHHGLGRRDARAERRRRENRVHILWQYRQVPSVKTDVLLERAVFMA